MESGKKPIVAPPQPPGSARKEAPPTAAKTVSLRQSDWGEKGRGKQSGKQSGKEREVELGGHVGFDSLPQQLVRKATAAGFVFNILCVGETGIGKSTLMESLFNMPLEFAPSEYDLNTVELRSKTFDMSESGVDLKLTIVETAGFGEQLDKEKSAASIRAFVEKQYDEFLKEELKVTRNLPFFHDTRIHACLYFISPTGHGLKAIDVLTLKELAPRVNVIPIIAKADTTSKEELKRFKAKINAELAHNNILCYRFPEDDDTLAEQNRRLNAALPFAVVGSTDFVKKGGKSVRARSYPWGMVEVENEEHCDFVQLREALLRLNVEDLRARTTGRLYEDYRRLRLVQMGLDGKTGGGDFATALQSRQNSLAAEMAAAESEMKDRFVKRVEAKETELNRREEDLKARYAERRRDLAKTKEDLEGDLSRLTQEVAYIRDASKSATLTGKKRK